MEIDSEDSLVLLASVSLIEMRRSSEDRPSPQVSEDSEGSEGPQQPANTPEAEAEAEAEPPTYTPYAYGTHNIRSGSVLLDDSVNIVLPHWFVPMHYPNEPWKEFFNDAEHPFQSIDRLHEMWNRQIVEKNADLYILNRYLPNRDVRLPESRFQEIQRHVLDRLRMVRSLLQSDNEHIWSQRFGVVLYVILRGREWGTPNEEENMLFLGRALGTWQVMFEFHTGNRH